MSWSVERFWCQKDGNGGGGFATTATSRVKEVAVQPVAPLTDTAYKEEMDL